MSRDLVHDLVQVPAAMIGSSVWAILTGDLFLPSLFGATFSLWVKKERDANNELTISDLIILGTASVFIGLIAGPYVASHLPTGEGVNGIGAVIASYWGAAVFMNLDIPSLIDGILKKMGLK